MMVAAAVMLSAPASMAQKINAESYLSKLAKSDAAIENEKKASKAATWLARGDEYVSALQAPTESIFVGLEAAMVKVACGEPTSVSSETIRNTEYEVYVYPYFNAYLSGGKLVGWKETKAIYEGADKVAIEAYMKAYQLDNGVAAKAKEGLHRLINYYAQVGEVGNALYDFESAADAYNAVYDVQVLPAYNDPNSTMLYYAGYMYTVAANEKPALYPKGAVAFNKAIEADYPAKEKADAEIPEGDKGNIFYYLYHCYYGQKDADAANVQKSKDALVMGVEMFPKNQRILDALAQLYTTEEGMGDLTELVAMIDTAIEADPKNGDLWYSRGRVFFSLKDYDNAISSFDKVTEFNPDGYDGHFYKALFYIYKGDALNEAISTKTYTSNSAYNKDVDAANAVYAEAIPILERAHEISPDNISPVEYLKSICFRLRDEEGIMDKYTKYNDLFKSMQANQ